MNAFTLLADDVADNNFGDTMSGGLAGPMGLLVILLLAIGTILLIRNMNTRLRRLPERFPADDRSTPSTGTTAGSAADRPDHGRADRAGNGVADGPADPPFRSPEDRSQPRVQP
jgi:hypothetical protein